jgi:O-antigen biosynthesis protein
VAEGDSMGALIAGNEWFPATIRCMPAKSRNRDSREQSAVVVNMEDSTSVRSCERVLLESSSGESEPVELAVTDIASWVGALSDLPESAREEIRQFVTTAASPYGERRQDMALSKRLFLIREALRERLPSAQISPDAPRACVVEALMRVDETAFWIQGWMHDSESPITRLTAVSPEGERVELLDRSFRYPRADIAAVSHDYREKYGFISYFELKQPSFISIGWIVEVENAAGTAIEAPAPEAVRDTIPVRNSILRGIPLDALPDEWFMVGHVEPAVSRLQRQTRERARIASVTDYGEPDDDPEVSIVIPLYLRTHFLEHQLVQFVADPDIRANELIYVLDSPEMARYVHFSARELFRLYGVPFRLVEMEESVGFACATNAGVSTANGRLLLMMNSDVLPDKPGWLSTMQRFYDSTENIGALGPKLLYEDDAIQHAGMYFHVPNDATFLGIWANAHYFKGMNRELPAANVIRPVPAVTGACLMIDKDLYERVGGLPELYLQGDHEDSELCLRLIQEGFENWYLPEVELYHLEGSSYDWDLRARLALYNRWLHTRRCGDLMAEVMAGYPLPELDGPPHYRQTVAARPLTRHQS